MYLYRKSYVHSADYYNPEQKEEIQMTRGGIVVDTSKIRYIIEDVGYWRKANHIHKWFVDNVQNGKDDCGDYRVEEDQLANLLETCKEVLKDRDKASELLPTTSGFFFGTTDYDEYYFGDIQNTIDIIESLFETDLDGGSYLKGDIYYSSSW
jgi:hypothetical protein